jgi:hypothetical protein
VEEEWFARGGIEVDAAGVDATEMETLRLTKNSGNAQRQAVRRWGNWWGLQELDRGCFPAGSGH